MGVETGFILICMMQILSLSVITPLRWRHSVMTLLKQYPAEQYPLFYVSSEKAELRHLFIRLSLDGLFLICALLFIFKTDLNTSELNILPLWAMFTALQLIPSFYSFLALRGLSKQRQKQPKRKLTKVSLTPRRLSDYLPYSYLILIGLCSILIIKMLLKNDVFQQQQTIALIGLFLLTMTALALRLYKILFGRHHDKLINEEDRAEKRRLDVQHNIIGMALTLILFAFMATKGNPSNTQIIGVIFPLSLLIQLTILHRTKRWHANDMAVYQPPK